MLVSYRTIVVRELNERSWVGKVVGRLMDLILISETKPFSEHLMKAHLHGFWLIWFHEENKEKEGEELKVESHERRARPSWFRPEVGRRKAEIDSNAMLRRIRWVCILNQSSLLLLPPLNLSWVWNRFGVSAYLLKVKSRHQIQAKIVVHPYNGYHCSFLFGIIGDEILVSIHILFDLLPLWWRDLSASGVAVLCWLDALRIANKLCLVMLLFPYAWPSMPGKDINYSLEVSQLCNLSWVAIPSFAFPFFFFFIALVSSELLIITSLDVCDVCDMCRDMDINIKYIYLYIILGHRYEY